MSSRTRTFYDNEGSYIFGGYQMGNKPFESGYETVQSADGVSKGEFFKVTRKQTLKPILLNGNVDGVGSPKYQNYIPHGCRAGMLASHIDIAGRPSNGELASRLAARTNPSAPSWGLPQAIFELRDLARTFSITRASTVAEYIGSNYLRLEFGIKPLLRDIQSLFQAEELIQQRFQRLKKMRDNPNKAESHKMRLWQGTASATVNDFLIHNGESVTGNVARTTCHNTWGWITWTPSKQNYLPANDEELRALAKKTALGINLANVLSTAWELIPFSWLADYFSSVGDYLVANQNVVGATISNCCIMDHIRTTESVQLAYVYPGLKGSSGAYVYETKQRTPTFPSLQAHLPIFTSGQIAILGALAASRSGFPRN